MRQQRGADAAGAAPGDDARITGPETSVLEPSPVPTRPPQGSDAVQPAGSDPPGTELLGVPQADSGGIAGKTVRAGGCDVRWCRDLLLHLLVHAALPREIPIMARTPIAKTKATVIDDGWRIPDE